MICNICGEPANVFYGLESDPTAVLCPNHDAIFVKSNMKARGRMLRFISTMKRAADGETKGGGG